MNIYYKIYKLYQRNIPIQQISVTTHIPAKTIRDIIARFGAKVAIKDESEIEKFVDPFLDYTITRYHKYVIIDFYGMLIERFAEKVKEALEEAKQMQGQVLAIKLDSITEIDDFSVDVIFEFKKRIARASGKSIVFLSPNNLVEEYIQTNNIEEKINIFGTQRAFEEYIFKHVSGITSRIPRTK